MVEKDFVEKFKTVLDALEERHGDVALFALFMMDDIADKWTIILSAKWVSDFPYEVVFNELQEVSLSALDQRDHMQIARAGIFNTTDHLVEQTLAKYNGRDIEFVDEKINGNYVHRGYILKADRTAL